MRALSNGKEVVPMDYSQFNNGEFVATDYGFVNNKGIEVCSDYELSELDED